MNVQNATPDVTTKRIGDICLLSPLIRTRIEHIRKLEEEELPAVYVLPDDTATRKQIAFKTFEVLRNYTIFLICARAKGKSVEEELEAFKAAYPFENLLPKLFFQRQQLQLNGNDGIVFKALMMSDGSPVLAPMSKNSDPFGMWKFTLPIKTVEEG